MQSLLTHWADALLEWLGLASAQDSGWDRWVAFTLVLLAVALFDFVWNCVGALDSMDEGVANFHLWFLANLSRFLGFCPGNEYASGDWFDIREGLYTKIRPTHVSYMNRECACMLRDFLECDVRCLSEIGLNRGQRVEFLNAVLVYFGYHLDAISAVQSVRILREVF